MFLLQTGFGKYDFKEWVRQQIGIVDGDKDDIVCEYKGYSSDEWIINYYVIDSAMLHREIHVTDIPDGLQSEYKWNN